jgi:hypothetical protein
MRVTVRVLSGLTKELAPARLEWFDLSSRPLLELARRDAAPARSVKVEWLVDRFEDGAVKTRSLSNYTQILRQPIRPKLKDDGRLETFAEAAKRAVEQILDDAERVLWYGRPIRDFSGSHPFSMCGGVLHYLRRRLYENDTVSLRELRPLTLVDYRSLYDTHADGEWLWEFSLQVNAGHYQRGMSPVCLPPEPRPVKPWAQGASLHEEEQS